jgi:hypothetical protein
MRPDVIRQLLPLLLIGCGGPLPQGASVDSAASSASTPRWVVSPSGVGGVRIGMTVVQLNAALGDSLKPLYEFNDECDYVHPATFPGGMSLMVEQDTIVRIDVDSAGILTPKGVGVGDTEERVMQVYGTAARVSPHHYTGPEGHYVTVIEGPDSAYRTVFETDGKRVLAFRAGRTPAVEYVEGCM